MCEYVCVFCVQRLENSLLQSCLSFHHVSPADQTEIVGLGSKCLSLLGHLANPHVTFVEYVCGGVCVCMYVEVRVTSQELST